MKAHFKRKNDSEAHPSDSQVDAVLREWRDSAFYWQKHLDMIRVMFAPLTQALIGDAGIIEGDLVLDVAGGSSEPSLTIAETVGPTGSVTLHRCRRRNGDGRKELGTAKRIKEHCLSALRGGLVAIRKRIIQRHIVNVSKATIQAAGTNERKTMPQSTFKTRD